MYATKLEAMQPLCGRGATAPLHPSKERLAHIAPEQLGARGQPTYCQASGERLATTENPGVLQTLDRPKQFALRQP